MKIEESLTKENFWNEIEEKYPNAFKIFSDWIDEYKKEINWNNLFGSYTQLISDRINGNITKQTNSRIKFHDIPHAMQLGIWIAFTSKNSNSHNQNKFFDLRLDIQEWMHNYEETDSM